MKGNDNRPISDKEWEKKTKPFLILKINYKMPKGEWILVKNLTKETLKTEK